MYWLKHFTLWFIITMQLLTFAACTTMSHEPECVCDCKKNNAHFECGGMSQYESVEIK